MHRLYRKIKRKISRIAGIPNIYGRLDALDQRISTRYQTIETEFTALETKISDLMFLHELRLKAYTEALFSETITASKFEARLSDHASALSEFVSLRVDEAVQASQANLKTHFEDALSSAVSDLRKSIDGLRISSLHPRIEPVHYVPEYGSLPNDLYQSFEDKFRGSETEISNRLRPYLDLLPEPTPASIVVDIGSGRGEWLDLLRQFGHRSFGVETNLVSVEICRQKGLDVLNEDGLDFLIHSEDESYAALTLFHVVEHLSIPTLLSLAREALRVLSKEGTLICEFPNIFCPSVGSTSFWIDPTHVRPLHPLLVDFIFSQVGFKSTRIVPIGLRDNPFEGDYTQDELTRVPDIAVIGQK
jgi:SAM-dependent methyltransferase